MSVDPVHYDSGPSIRWSRVNFAEAIQGVQTPLGWGFWDEVMENAVRRSFGAIGALRRRDVPPPASVDRKFACAFYGQVAGNVSLMHEVGEAIPGTSGGVVVEQMFGERRGAVPAAASSPLRVLRYPLVAAKMLGASVRAVRVMPGMRAAHRAWWHRATCAHPPADEAEATALLAESAAKFIEVGVHHGVLSMIGQALAEQIENLAARAWGDRERASELMTGYGQLEETELISDIWSTARDEMGVEEFLSRHGFHGPNEGDLAAPSWREDPAPAVQLIGRYRTAALDDPRTRETTQQRHREAAERELLAALAPPLRPGARLLLHLGRRVVPMRELGKAGFLHAIDGARCAARALGRHLAADNRIADPADVFLLTYRELLDGIHAPMHAEIDERRARDQRYRQLTLPAAWTGNPQPTPLEIDDRPATPVGELRGIGVVGEEITGRARVVLVPGEADLEPGDVLVCRTTDPSWTPLFALAEALVIDTGGQMSHGAIVARELGITCVINTATGTRDIPDGATVTVNGRTGVVCVLHTTAAKEPT